MKTVFTDHNISIEEFEYALPEDRIAKYPLNRRDESRLLIYDRGDIGAIPFRELTGKLSNGDMLVYNNTRVIQARILFKKQSGANIEIFCLEPADPPSYEQSFSTGGSVDWKCLIGNAKKWREGELKTSIKTDHFEIILTARQVNRPGRDRIIRFSWEPAQLTFGEVLEQAGKTPIPPYLNRASESSDKINYQTVYSRHKGSVAAPTAGLHFTDDVLNTLKVKGIPLVELTLHIGADTFRPVIGENAGKHLMHNEHIYFSRKELKALLDWTQKIVAVGTTTTRLLETIFWLGIKVLRDEYMSPADLYLNQWEAYRMEPADREKSLRALVRFMDRHEMERFETTTQLMIVPGYTFRMVDKLVTNFHQPRSTLLLLVGAFIGDDWKKVYQYALENGFRFLSYGDASFLIPDIEY